MNPISKLFDVLRTTKQLDAHIKAVLVTPFGGFSSPVFEGFLDWLETNPSVKWLMVSEFDYKRPYTRDDLKAISANLRAGGVRVEDIMKTFASRSALSPAP